MSYTPQAPADADWRGAPLFYKGRDERLRSWEVWSKGDKLNTTYGIVGGTYQVATKTVKGKGKGAAQTTSQEQAEKEARAKHKHNLDRKYVTNPSDASLPLELPMLADSFYNKEYELTPKGKKLMAKDVDTQPKIDGARGLGRRDGNDVLLISRSGKLWKGLEHITDPLKRMLPPNWEVDGELYLHGIPLQTIMSWLPKENAKKFKPERFRLEYWVFDVPVVDGDPNLPWIDRREALCPTTGTSPLFGEPMIKIVPYRTIKDIDHFYELEAKFIAKGFEGAMLRTHCGKYNYGRRSPDILKAKRFQDSEYEIVGFTDGDGKAAGSIVFECITDDGKKFEVVPRGSMPSRQKMFQNGGKFVGELLTVRHQKFTNDGVPFIPVGIPGKAILRHSFDLA